MKKFIKAYVREILESLNERFDETIVLNELTATKAFAQAPLSQVVINWTVILPSVSIANLANRIMRDVSVRVDLSFSLAGKIASDVDTIYDRYLTALLRLFNDSEQYSNDDISTALLINEISGVTITNDERVENNFYMPSIEFQLLMSDYSEERTLTSTKTGT